MLHVPVMFACFPITLPSKSRSELHSANHFKGTEIRTPNLLVRSQTRCLCAIPQIDLHGVFDLAKSWPLVWADNSAPPPTPRPLLVAEGAADK